MALQAAELYVSVGVKNSDKSVSALTEVKKTLGAVQSSGIATKAAIIGAIYALQHFMGESAHMGMGLSNFSALTGESTKRLQQWQYAAQQAGMTAEEFTSNYKSVFDKIGQIKMNKGTPEFLGYIAQTVGFDINKAYKDKFYAIQKLIEFANVKGIDKDKQNLALKSWFSDGMISASRKGVFNQKNFSAAPFYNNKEISSLSKVEVMWANFEQKVKMFFGKETAKHGEELTKEFTKFAESVLKYAPGIVTQITEITLALAKLANRFLDSSAFSGILEIIKGFLTFLNFTIKGVTGLTDFVSGSIDAGKKMEDDMRKKGAQPLMGLPKGMWTQPVADTLWKDGLYAGKLLGIAGDSASANVLFAKGLAETAKSVSKSLSTSDSIKPNINKGFQSPKQNNTTINQNVYFQDHGKDHAKTTESVKKSVYVAWKQLSSQIQVT